MLQFGRLFACLLLTATWASAQSASVRVIQEQIRTKTLAGESRLQIPIVNDGAATRALFRIEVVEPSGVLSASSERDIELAGGESIADLPLMLSQPRQFVAVAKWRRLRYRLVSEAGDESTGVVSLAATMPKAFQLRAAYGERARAGQAYVAHIRSENPLTHAAIGGVVLKGSLEFKEQNDQTQHLAAKSRTDSHGEAVLRFQLPKTLSAEEGTLEVEGENEESTESLQLSVNLRQQKKLILQTDKQLYQPGQPVHMRLLAFSENKEVLAGKTFTLTIKDEESEEVFGKKVETNQFGIAAIDWQIPDGTRLGDYNLIAESSNPESTDDSWELKGFKQIKISRYDLPNFSVRVTPDRVYYLAGQQPVVTIAADYLFGKPVKSAGVRLVREEARRWNYAEQKYDVEEKEEIKGRLDESGKFIAWPQLQQDFADLKDEEYRRYRDISYAAYVTDSSTGRTEQRRLQLRLSRKPIHVYLQNDGWVNGKATYYITTQYPDGTPASCSLQLLRVTGEPDDKGNGAPQESLIARLRTNRFGLARVEDIKADPESGDASFAQSLKVIATDAHGASATEMDPVQQYRSEQVYRVRSSKSIYREGEPVLLDIGSNIDDALVDVDAIGDGQLISTQRVHLRHGKASAVFPYVERFTGRVAFVVYSLDHGVQGNDVPYGIRRVLFPHDDELQLKVKLDKSTYHPADPVRLEARLSDPQSGGTAGAIGLTIVDTAVEERVRTDTDFGSHGRYYWWDWDSWYANSGVAGVTTRDLLKLDMGKPLPEGYDLLAEVLLRSEYDGGPRFAGFDEDNVSRETLRGGMQRSLGPLLARLWNDSIAGDPPRNREELDRFLQQKGFSPDLLLDVWQKGYRVSFEPQYSDYRITFQSAGPDGRFDTRDDLEVATFRRGYFLKYEGTIRAALAAAFRGGRFPQSGDDIVSEVGRLGLDLRAAHDPWGRPYEIEVSYAARCTLQARALGATKASGAPYSGYVVWQESFDYFAPLRQRVDEILTRSYQATGRFPRNVVEFETSLKEGGLDLSQWRDPFGNAYYAEFPQHAEYSDRVQVSVTAGQTEQRSSTPVTARLEDIMIRTAGRDGVRGTADDATVAQFHRVVTEQAAADARPQPVARGATLGYSGAITGVVTDPSGAVVPNATITATLIWNQQVYTAVADAAGRFLLRNLPAGDYLLSVTAPGMVAYRVDHVPVSSANLTTVDVSLNVGGAMETVTVEAEALVVQTESAQLSAAKEAKTEHAGGRAAIHLPGFTPRVRGDFPETAYWNPFLETDATGRGRATFKLADNITTWHLSAVASTKKGRVGTADLEFRAFQPFFVEHDPPRILTEGDFIGMPVVLRNYLDKDEMLDISLTPAAWFKMSAPVQRRVKVSAGDYRRVVFPIAISASVTNQKQRVTAQNKEIGDAVEKPVTVHPDGEERFARTAALLDANHRRMTIEVPPAAIPGSLHAQLRIYPNLAAHVIEGVEAVLTRPNGCGEQTISSAYPSLLVLKWYEGREASDPTILVKARGYLQAGYDRLLTYKTGDGGFSYWGHGDADASLTAYALQFLREARPYVTVDDDVMADAEAWLLRQQQKDGTFQARYGSSDVYSVYILRTLAELSLASESKRSADVEAALKKALSAASWMQSSPDPYILAQYLLLEEALGDSARVATDAQRLRQMAHASPSGSYWELHSNTAFYGWGAAGRVETTALAMRALAPLACSGRKPCNPAADDEVLHDGLRYLLTNKDQYHQWYSSHTTTDVLRTLLALTSAEQRTASAPVMAIAVNGTPLHFEHDPQLGSDQPLLLELDDSLHPGSNQLEVGGLAQLSLSSAQVVANYYVPWSNQVADRVVPLGEDYALGIAVAYSEEIGMVGDKIICRVKAERAGHRGYGMMVAEIGLPPGADVDRQSLEAVMNKGWTIDHYDILPDRVLLYLWPQAGGSSFEFQFSPRFAERARTAPSSLYDYYNPEARGLVAPKTFHITDKQDGNAVAEVRP